MLKRLSGKVGALTNSRGTAIHNSQVMLDRRYGRLLQFSTGFEPLHDFAAPWCSGLTYCPVKAEIAGSNPVGVANHPFPLGCYVLMDYFPAIRVQLGGPKGTVDGTIFEMWLGSPTVPAST